MTTIVGGVRFPCPFCPEHCRGVVIANPNAGAVLHTMPVCKRYDAIHTDQGMVDFLTDCRKLMAKDAPS